LRDRLATFYIAARYGRRISIRRQAPTIFDYFGNSPSKRFDFLDL